MLYRSLKLLGLSVALVVLALAMEDSGQVGLADKGRAQGEEIYVIGMISDLRTTNTMRTANKRHIFFYPSTASEQYVLGMRHCRLMHLSDTQFYYVPGLAASLPEPFVPEKGPDGLYSHTVKLKNFWKWSDGKPVTADDVVFSMFEGPKLFGNGDFEKGIKSLGRGWTVALDPNVLAKVEKIDDFTVKLSYKKLSLRIHYAILFADIFQKAYWEPKFKAAAPDRTKLEGLVVDDEPSCGAFSFPEAQKKPGKGWERGAFVTNVVVPDYSGKGIKVIEYKDGKYIEEKPGVYRYEQVVLPPLTKEQGGVSKTAEYTVGPHIDKAIYLVFGLIRHAIKALDRGDIDFLFLLNPLGLDPYYRAELAKNPNVATQENKSNGMFYISFNHRRKPFGSGPLQADPKFRDDDIIGSRFRQAVNCLIDRQFTTDVLFQRAAFPLFSMVSPGNPYWFNAEVQKLIPCAEFTALTNPTTARAKKVAEAVKILKSVGFTWELEPVADTKTGEVKAGRGIFMPAILKSVEHKLAAGAKVEETAPAGTIAAGVKVVPSTAKVTVSLGALDLAGKGSASLAAGAKVSITATDAATVRIYFYGKGEKMKEFEFISPSFGYAAAHPILFVRVDGWMNQIGIPSRAVPTGFNVIVTAVFDEQDFDMWSLGWLLGSPTPPDYLEAFFHTRHTEIGDDNVQGYSNPEVDALLDQFLETLELTEARKIAFRLQEILAVESPYVPLFDTVIVDAWRSDKVGFPFTERTGGIVGLGGMPHLVNLKK